jgi:hypothetical protein
MPQSRRMGPQSRSPKPRTQKQLPPLSKTQHPHPRAAMRRSQLQDPHQHPSGHRRPLRQMQPIILPQTPLHLRAQLHQPGTLGRPAKTRYAERESRRRARQTTSLGCLKESQHAQSTRLKNKTSRSRASARTSNSQAHSKRRDENPAGEARVLVRGSVLRHRHGQSPQGQFLLFDRVQRGQSVGFGGEEFAGSESE